jgi:hydroxymethylpyrimidine/phosphomethylpyrimidine kinase
MVFAAMGLFGTAAITAMTVQSTNGVRTVEPLRSGLLRDMLACLDEDLPPAGVKIGMLGSADAVAVVAEYLEKLRARSGRTVPVVLDPVLVSSSGRDLLGPGGVEALRERLLPLVDWVTPNTGELAMLSGMQVSDASQQRAAAGRLVSSYSQPGVLATGGHLRPPSDLLVERVGLSAGEPGQIAMESIPGAWVETSSTHGTGCLHSSAFLARLVLGDAPVVAAREAKAYVTGALRAAPGLGRGKGPLAPFWQMRPISS